MEYINEPINADWTEKDMMEDFDRYKDKKIIARRYCITVKEVTEIFKKAGKKNVSEG